MQFELVTLSGALYQGEVEGITLPTLAGQISVLPHHEPLTSVTKTGNLVIRPRHGKVETFLTHGGILEVTQTGATLLADEADHLDDLIEEEIAAALAEARHLHETAASEHQLAHARRLVERHTARLDVARTHRRRHL